MYVCMYVRMYVCMYVCMYVHMYLRTYCMHTHLLYVYKYEILLEPNTFSIAEQYTSKDSIHAYST